MLKVPLLWIAVLARQALMGGARIAYANRRAAYYAVGFIALFAVVYWLMGLEKHFDTPEYLDKQNRSSFLNCVYTSALAQSNAMPDYTPKTNLARILFMAQVCTGWAWFLLFSSHDNLNNL